MDKVSILTTCRGGGAVLCGPAASGEVATGSEWVSYAALVSGSGVRAGGSVARTALREAAEEAGERLARQGARQAASRGFASLDEALRATTLQRFESLPEELYIYVRGDIAQKIMASGKIGRAEGEIVYLTTKGNLSPLQAQLELALLPSNTAEVVRLVPKRILDPSRVMLIRPVTGNIYNAPGGGIEILYRGRIDWRW